MHCSSGQSTTLHQHDSLTSWKTIMSFSLTGILAAVRCNWSAQLSLFDRCPCPHSDAAGWGKPDCRQTRNRYRRRHTVDTPLASCPIILGHPHESDRRRTRRQFLGYWHLMLTKSIACCPCWSQMTTSRRIESSSAPFFSRYLDLSGNTFVFRIDIALEPGFWNTRHSSNSS